MGKTYEELVEQAAKLGVHTEDDVEIRIPSESNSIRDLIDDINGHLNIYGIPDAPYEIDTFGGTIVLYVPREKEDLEKDIATELEYQEKHKITVAQQYAADMATIERLQEKWKDRKGGE